MQNLIRSLAAVVVLVSVTGCYKYALKVGSGGDVNAQPASTEWSHHFIAGAVGGDGVIDVSAVCPSGNATVKIERNVVDAVLGNVVGNVLWQPSTIEVFCGDGRAAALTLDEKSGTKLARSQEFADAVAAVAPEKLPEVLAYQAR